MHTPSKYNELIFKMVHLNPVIFSIVYSKKNAKRYPGLPFYPRDGGSKF